MTTEQMIECIDCKGEGAIDGIACSDTTCEPTMMHCFRCNSTGQMPEAMLEWIENGKALRADRLSRNLTMRDEADRLNISVVLQSHREAGKVPVYPEKTEIPRQMRFKCACGTVIDTTSDDAPNDLRSHESAIHGTNWGLTWQRNDNGERLAPVMKRLGAKVIFEPDWNDKRIENTFPVTETKFAAAGLPMQNTE